MPSLRSATIYSRSHREICSSLNDSTTSCRGVKTERERGEEGGGKIEKNNNIERQGWDSNPRVQSTMD